jgi:hypothetical protein
MIPESELSLATVVPYANSPIMTASSKITDITEIAIRVASPSNAVAWEDLAES